MHLTENQLQTYFDGEMPAPERERTAHHLQTCPDCQTALQQIESRVGRVESLLTHLDPTLVEIPLTPRAYATLQQKLTQKEPAMFQKLFSPKMRPVLTTGLIIALLAIALTVPSIRATAVEFLGLFRVQQIEVVEFNPANLPQNLDSSLNNLDQLIANNLKIEESGDPVEVTDAAEASSLAGFNVILPQDIKSNSHLTVQPETTASFFVDLSLWQGLLDEMNRSDIQIPTELDGQTITFYADKSVTYIAGACVLDQEEFERVPFEQRNCTLLVQTPSPTIDAPPTLPINEIAQAALQFLGMSAEEAASFSEKIDWTTTLLVPIPTGAQYREVTVQGVTGTIFIGDYEHGRSQATLMWVKNGIVYSLTAPGSVSEILELANSLK
ncbi:MAG TPA: zf-HC2 domain-containing protein [Anaerolineales bacterium]|nr:zf-HC2 domain-containing protein [Anaerolineales bacterium]